MGLSFSLASMPGVLTEQQAEADWLLCPVTILRGGVVYRLVPRRSGPQCRLYEGQDGGVLKYLLLVPELV
jgi:hypothetical protein